MWRRSWRCIRPSVQEAETTNPKDRERLPRDPGGFLDFLFLSPLRAVASLRHLDLLAPRPPGVCSRVRHGFHHDVRWEISRLSALISTIGKSVSSSSSVQGGLVRAHGLCGRHISGVFREDAVRDRFLHNFKPSRAVGVDVPPCLSGASARFQSTHKMESQDPAPEQLPSGVQEFLIDLGDGFFWPSTSHLFPAVTCSVSASLDELRKIGFSGR